MEETERKECVEGKPVYRKAKLPTLDTACLAQSLQNLVFFIGGSHATGLVDEAYRAAWKGMVVKYE